MQESEGVFQKLKDEHSPFVVPILIAPDENLLPDEIHCGSGCLIDTGKRQLLVTCFHVWQHFASCDKGAPGKLVVGIGSGHGAAINIRRPNLISSNEELDLATIDFTASKGFLKEQKFYPLHLRGTSRPSPGQAVSIIGFPRPWRREGKGWAEFGWTPIPLVISDVGPRNFIAAEAGENQEVFDDLDSCLVPGLHDSLGGLSGAPAFMGEDGDFGLAGFVTRRGSGALFFSHASSIQRDGSLTA